MPTNTGDVNPGDVSATPSGEGGVRGNGSTDVSRSLLVRSLVNRVLTLRFNDPRRKNAWGHELLSSFFEAMGAAATDEDVSAVILTGTGDYYCSGVDFVSTLKAIGLMRPSSLQEAVRANNEHLFDTFINFPKPLLCAANGPLIGAAATSATLCDAILAAPSATFHTPFAALGLVPEGCSSYWFPKAMGAEAAARMLGDEMWAPTAAEAKALGFVDAVVVEAAGGGPAAAFASGSAPSCGLSGGGGEVEGALALQAAAQALAEQWVAEGKVRSVVASGERETLLRVNAEESARLAEAFILPPFLAAMHQGAASKGKKQLAAVFGALLKTRFLWSRL